MLIGLRGYVWFNLFVSVHNQMSGETDISVFVWFCPEPCCRTPGVEERVEGLSGLTSEDVKQLGSNGLLTQLVVFKLQFVKKFLGVVIGTLHSHDT